MINPGTLGLPGRAGSVAPHHRVDGGVTALGCDYGGILDVTAPRYNMHMRKRPDQLGSQAANGNRWPKRYVSYGSAHLTTRATPSGEALPAVEGGADGGTPGVDVDDVGVDAEVHLDAVAEHGRTVSGWDTGGEQPAAAGMAQDVIPARRGR